MPTNDERRRVAAALREKLSEGSPYSIYESVCYALGKTENEGNWDVIARLADLIDPGENHFADAGKMVDREALLALADKMQGQQYMREDARFLRWDEAARRIREALGEVDGHARG